MASLKIIGFINNKIVEYIQVNFILENIFLHILIFTYRWTRYDMNWSTTLYLKNSILRLYLQHSFGINFWGRPSCPKTYAALQRPAKTSTPTSYSAVECQLKGDGVWTEKESSTWNNFFHLIKLFAQLICQRKV